MRVEILVTRLSDQDQAPGGQHYLAEKGDTLTVPDHLGRKWCALGWVKDVDGAVTTGELKPGGRSLAKVLKEAGFSNEDIETNIPDEEIPGFRTGKLGKDGEVTPTKAGAKHTAKMK